MSTSNAVGGYYHSKETILKMKTNYSEERKLRIGNLNKNRPVSLKTKELRSVNMKLRYLRTDLKSIISTHFSKPVNLFSKDNILIKEFDSISSVKKEFSCCTKTINKALRNKSLFKNIGLLKYKTRN